MFTLHELRALRDLLRRVFAREHEDILATLLQKIETEISKKETNRK